MANERNLVRMDEINFKSLVKLSEKNNKMKREIVLTHQEGVIDNTLVIKL